MPITSGDTYIAAAKQRINWAKTASRTAVATFPTSVFDLAGNPGAGVLAGASVAAGVVPTDATPGCPVLNAFGGGATGYLSKVEFGSSVAGWIDIYDMLWKGGAYAFNAAQTLTAQPSYAGRLPGTDYKRTEIWVEQVTAGTGIQNVNVTYTNQDGVAGRVTGATAFSAAPILGRMMQLPLQAGDSGVQKIENVVGTIATVGTFNVLVLRPIWSGRIQIANGGDKDDMFKTGLPEIFADSALFAIITPDSTATGIPAITFEIANA